MIRTLSVVAFVFGLAAAPAFAGAGCGSVTTAQTSTGVEVAQTDHAGPSTHQTPKVESSSD